MIQTHIVPTVRLPLTRAVTAMAVLGLLILGACADPDQAATPAVVQGAGNQGAAPAQVPAQGQGQGPEESPDESKPEKPTAPKVYTYEVIAKYPHDRGAYTQGLLWLDGKLYESTGQRGESTLRLVDLETGKVIKKRALPRQVFGEGLAAINGFFYMLTWKAGQAFVYDIKTLRPLSYTYAYPGEGWGLTTCEEGLVMSNGTEVIRFLDPKGMKLIRQIRVQDRGRPVYELNELEWIDGEIWANVWKSNRIARIDPKTGTVNAWVDMSGLLGKERVALPEEEVLNGIAYDKDSKRLFMTGKRWPFLYHVELREK